MVVGCCAYTRGNGTYKRVSLSVWGVFFSSFSTSQKGKNVPRRGGVKREESGAGAEKLKRVAALGGWTAR